MHNKFSPSLKAVFKALLAGLLVSATSFSANAQNSLAVDAMNAAAGKPVAASEARTATAGKSGAPTGPAVTATEKPAAAAAATLPPEVEVETTIRPKGKQAVQIPSIRTGKVDQAEVASPSGLTRKQDVLDQLEKDDQIEAKRLSIASKQKQYRSLSGADEGRMRGSIKVMGIEGRTRDLVATVRYATGEEFEVRAGDILPDGKRVAAISSTGITLAAGKSSSNIPITLASGRASPPRSDSLPPERIMVPMGGAIPAPAAMSR